MTKGPLTEQVVRDYWDEKAANEGHDPRVTINDHEFRKLEIEFVKDYLSDSDRILDVGCGNGYSTLDYARCVEHATGVDYSAPMAEAASTYAAEHAQDVKNVEFRQADARDLPFADKAFDKVVMERCLINIPDVDGQKKAVREAHRVLKNGGLFILAEVTHQGHAHVNRLRNMFGLANLKVHWHNTYLDEEVFLPFFDEMFEVVDIHRFGMYGFISKVLHPLLVAPEEPRFDAKINEIARIIGRKIVNFQDASHQVMFVLRAP